MKASARLLVAAALLAAFAAGLALGVRGVPWLRGGLGRAGPETVEPAAAAGPLWTCGMHPQVIQERPGTCPMCGMALTPLAGSGTAPPAAGGEREIAYWWDPMMSPPYIADGPGQSPMGMELVPVYADEVAAGAALVIDPTVVQNMGLRVATVEETALSRTIRAVGVLAQPEPARHDVSLRVAGWIDRLHAATEGMRIARGEELFDLYSPELQVAVGELIGARRLRDDPAAGEQSRALFESAVLKLELYGVGRGEIDALAALEAAPRAVTIRSPASGYLIEKRVYPGSAVMAGDTVMSIADTSRLWLDARVFEKDLPHVALDQAATARVDARPGETFAGRVILVHPRIDPATRTALVRTEIDNPELGLRQGMFATVFLEVEIAPRTLVVPRAAIIDSGTRQVAFVALDGGHFEPRLVEMGASGDGGRVQVLAGLAPGEQVVTSGQFLLDAESRMQEAIQRFLQEKALPGGDPVQAAEPGGGVLEGVGDDWKRAVEGVLAAYLELARTLGGPQESGAPVAVGTLAAAASGLVDHAASAEQTRIAGTLAAGVAAMPDRPIAEQRVLFGEVSEAVIELAERSPRSGELVPRVYLVRCPMIRARWLQDSPEIANPYYATTMKACGEVEHDLPVPGGAAPHEHGGQR